VKDCGKEKFDPIDKTCLTCPNNLDCIMELSKEKGCPLYTTSNLCNYSAIYPCSAEQRKICSKITHILKERKLNCPNYGQPKKNNTEKCIKCLHGNSYIFENCEQSEVLIKNLSLTEEEARRILNRQINQLGKNEEDCFRNFNFEKDCWEECDFKIRCLSQTGVYPGKECTFFPKISNELIQIPKMEDFCKNCIFFQTCNPLFIEILEIIKKENEEKKQFRNFFSLNEMRTIFLKEKE
jgi:hypothetical protein